MVRQTRNIPQGKEHLVSDKEKEQARVYHDNSDSLYHKGIDIGEGSYDPEAGADKHPLRRPEAVPTPVLATDPGQPRGVGADLVSRERNKAVDKSERDVVRSSVDASPKASGRKAKPEGAESGNTESTPESGS